MKCFWDAVQRIEIRHERKREKQKEEEKVNKDRKMQSETIILRPEVPLLERLVHLSRLSDAYPFHMPGHKRQVKWG